MEKDYMIVRNQNLVQFNSMRIQAYAKQFIIPYSISSLIDVINDVYNSKPIIIGKGSNIIFSEQYYDRPIIYLGFLNNIQYSANVIYCETGVTLHDLSWFALEKSICGFEFLEDIPGSIGGALYMNAGTYDDTISQLVESVKIYDVKKGITINLDSLFLEKYWGKRESYFSQNDSIILSCELKASSFGNYENILDNMLSIKRNRYLKQPRSFPSAGSVFKRPYVNGQPYYIWKLFDEAGLRGYRIGDAQVSEKHPGFIVNVGNATGKDVTELVDYCKKIIKDKFDINIQEEWKIV